MSKYLPTRADALRVGDVVRNPYDAQDMIIEHIMIRDGWVWLYDEALDGIDGDIIEEVATFEPGDLLDKRLTDEEYGALSAPEDW